MRYVARFGGGLGDVFIKLYSHKRHNSLIQFKELGIVDAVSCCSNPAVKNVLESLQVFDTMKFYDWSIECTHMEDYVQQFPDAVNLMTVDAETFSHLPLTSFDEGNMHHYQYHLPEEELAILKLIRQNNYIVIHPSGGLQNVDGLSREKYATLIKTLLKNMPDIHILTIGSDHQRVWAESSDSKYEESPISVDNPRFIDLTNKTSGAFCANIVQHADAFIGTHSAWINMFWFFRKPTVCIYSETSSWGDWLGYQLTNGCNWGFHLPWTKAIPVKPEDSVEAVADLTTKYILGMNQWLN